MKKTLSLLFAAVIAVVLLAAPAYADDTYISGNAGMVLSRNADINQVNGGTLLTLPLSEGMNVVGAAGLVFDNIRIEGEFGYQKSGINDQLGKGHERMLSLLVNGYYDFTTEGIQPYVTAGAGAAQARLSRFLIGRSPDAFISNDSVTGFAYQFGAGVSFPISETILIDLRFRHFAMSEITEANLVKYSPSNNSVLLGLRIGI